MNLWSSITYFSTSDNGYISLIMWFVNSNDNNYRINYVWRNDTYIMCVLNQN